MEFDEKDKIISLEEKPTKPKSNYAVTGLYFYDNDVVKIASEIKPSSRGELEITDINSIYLDNSSLHSVILGRGFAWLDTGTPDSLLDAGRFVQMIEKRQGLKIACIEEIAFLQNWISTNELENEVTKYGNSQYGQYLKSILKNFS